MDEIIKLRELILHRFNYDKDTGIFTYKNPPISKSKDDIIGSISKKGYRVVTTGGRARMIHSLIWLYLYGYIPKHVDHINGIKDDNRIKNLREVTNRENAQNRKIHREGKLVGAHFISKLKTWRSAISARSLITNKNFTVQLGYFKTPQEAHEAYMMSLPYFKEN